VSLDELQQRLGLDPCRKAEVVLDERTFLERRTAVRYDDGVEPARLQNTPAEQPAGPPPPIATSYLVDVFSVIVESIDARVNSESTLD
jgi:hypothetical protein